MSPEAKAERRARNRALVPAPPRHAPVGSTAASMQAIQSVIEQSSERAKLRNHDPSRSPFRLPEFPPGIAPAKESGLAMDSMFGSGTALTWAGAQWAGGYMDGMVAEGLSFPGYAYLSELAQRPEYRTFAETISTEATRKWIKFSTTGQQAAAKRKADKESGNEDVIGAADEDLDDTEPSDDSDKVDNEKTKKIKELEDFLGNLKVRDRFCDMSSGDSYFGRMHLFLDFGLEKDARAELATPVADINGKYLPGKIAKGSLKGLKAVEPIWTYPLNYDATFPLAPGFYDPQIWGVNGVQVHKSRLLRFVGREVPDLLKPSYAFGGLSLTQVAKPYVDIWLTTRQSIGDLIHSFSVMVLMTDLATLLQPGGAAGLLARVALFNELRDNQGTFVVNKATEDFKNVSASISGLHELQAQAQEHMMSVARIPAVKFTGIQPTGLNASSEGEMRAFYDTIAAYQNRFFKPNLDYVIDVAQISLWGERDPDIVYEFESLWEMSEKEKGEKRKAEAETGQIHINTGAISAEEERKRIASDPDGLYHDIDPEDVPEPPAMPGMGGEGGEGGGAPGGGGGFPGAGGNGEGAAEDGVIPFAQDEAGWSESHMEEMDDGDDR